MVKERKAAYISDSDIIRVLHVMAHPARVRLLNALRNGEECVCHLTALLHQRQAYVSQQLMVLREAGLIQDRKESFRVYYRIQDSRVFPLLDAINLMRGARANTYDEQAMDDCPCPRCHERGGRGGDDAHQDIRSPLSEVPKARDTCHGNARANGPGRQGSRKGQDQD